MPSAKSVENDGYLLLGDRRSARCAGASDLAWAFSAPWAIALNWTKVTIRAINRNNFFTILSSGVDR